VEEPRPPARPVLVHLPEPLITALDAFGKRNGTGRGRSITTLLNGLLEVSEMPVVTEPARKELVTLELVQRTDPLYVQYRKDHYIPDRGV